jgi:proteic killer suppression protein
MDILFTKRNEQEIANTDAKLKKAFRGNPRRARLIRARLDELADADTLAVMRSLPQAYCHELTADRKGQLAVKLDKGYRLVFEVANDPLPLKTDGGLDWNQVTAVRVLKLAENYHD